MSLPNRKDVPVEQTWDLDYLYPNITSWENDLTHCRQLINNFKTKYQSNLTTSANFSAALSEYCQILKQLSWIEHYAFLKQAVDMTDPQANQLLHNANNFLAQANADLAFVKSAALAVDDKILGDLAEKHPEFQALIRVWRQEKQHQLPMAVEEALNKLTPVLNQPENTYTQARAADFSFPSFEVDGKTYPLSFVLYENRYQFSANHKVRRKAFKLFSKTLASYQNTLAANYYNQVLKEKTIATMRGFDSVFDYLLAQQEVSRDLFDRQIDVIMTKFGPVMQRYAKLLQKVHGLKEMTFADLQIDLDPSYAPKVDLTQAKTYVKNATAILGTDYQSMLLRAFKERWVDFAANAGKDSGGFETTPYGGHPYILMSWTDELADVYTLLHELGHAGQALLTQDHQSILASEPSRYIVEAPSTFNELLLTHSLTQNSQDKRLVRFAYTKMLTNTYYHNFITHLLEAAFQREVYRLVDAGQSFDGPKLCQLKKQVLKKFWGAAVVIDDDAALTWMRQSHYYMGLYSYSYSASLTIATQAYLHLLTDPKQTVANWLEFLKLGGSLPPLQAAKVAGVDVSTDKALEDTIAYLDEIVQKVTDLTEQLA